MGWKNSRIWLPLLMLATTFIISPAAFAIVDDPNAHLMYAAELGDVEGAKVALADGADANYISHPFGMSVLHSAAFEGYADIIVLLLKHGANINITDEYGATPLEMAASSNKKSVVEVLLAKGADPNKAENQNSIKAGYTPLHAAASDGLLDIASLLLDHGAKVNPLTSEGATPLDLAEGATTAELLLTHGAQIGGYSEDGETRLQAVDQALFTAILAGNVRGVRAAIGRGAHVDIRNSLHLTPLIQAVNMGRVEVVSALVENGADVNRMGTRFISPESPLHWAAARGQRDIVEILLRNGANPNAKGDMQQTPVDYAKDADTASLLFKFGASAADSTQLFCGLLSVSDGPLAELFLSHGFDANSQVGGCKDTTPLFSAIFHRHPAVAQALLDHGADPNLSGKNPKGTPLSIATDAEIVTQLLAHGAKIDALDEDGNTALINASRYYSTDVVIVLLSNKANTGIKGKDGVTALYSAKNIETMDLLLAHGANVDDLIPLWFDKIKDPTEKQKSLFRTIVAGSDDAVSRISSDDVIARDPLTQGQMAINLAVAFGRDKVLDWLLEHGADANVLDSDGVTPMHRVVLSRYLDSQRQVKMIRSLLSHGARIDPVAKGGWTPLHMAAVVFKTPVVEFLLSHGADPLLRTAEGYTALQLARQSSYGTALLNIMSQGDVTQKAATVDALNKVLISAPKEGAAKPPSRSAPPIKPAPVKAAVSQIPPTISIPRTLRTSTAIVDLAGKVGGSGKIATFKVDDSDAPINPDGTFAFRRSVPIGDSDVKLVATNEWGLSADAVVKVARTVPISTGPSFAPLEPARVKGKPRPKAIALIIGIERYEGAPPAEFAESDARSFYDYATNAMGVPRDRIKLLTGSDARRLDIRKAVLNWAKPLIVRGQTDVFVFFSGHGLASEDGNDLFLLPYDGDRTLLADSSIRRKEIIDTITDAGASSATFFLDTCYSGVTRSGETLIPSTRPIIVTAKEPQLPPNVTILAAARNDQLSNSLPAVKHGLFSYFLMKGLEGEAAGADRTITATKLAAYLAERIPPEAAKLGRTQTPQLIGDGSRVISAW